MSEIPYHLLYPLAASLVITVGALFIKRATSGGVSPWALTLTANLCASVAFSFFWAIGGEMPELKYLWQPAVIAICYICGQVFLLSAFSAGDVSIVLPIAGIKVLIVTGLLSLFGAAPPTIGVWIAAALATLGVVLINTTDHSSKATQLGVAAWLAIGAAVAFALFDVCVQAWSDNWGVGRILPIMYWMVGVFSLTLLPFVEGINALRAKPWRSMLVGSLCTAGQATFLVYALATSHDAARINVVYSLRGLWGVIAAVLAAKFFADWFGGNESLLSKKAIAARSCGAAILVAAVVITILAG